MARARAPLTARMEKRSSSIRRGRRTRARSSTRTAFRGASGCTLSVQVLGMAVRSTSRPAGAVPRNLRRGRRRIVGHAFEHAGGARTTSRTGRIVATIAPDAVADRPVQQHQAGLVIELPADRRLRRAGRLPTARVAGCKRRVRPDSTASPDRDPLVQRESQTWGEELHGLDHRAELNVAANARHRGHAASAARGQHRRLLLPERVDWVPIASGPTDLDPATIDLEAQSLMNHFAHQEVSVAWDNLRINSGTSPARASPGRTTHPTGKQ